MHKDLPKDIVGVIQKKTEEIINEYNIINPVIKDEIFNILGKLCIVLRYPLDDDEDANGLHVKRHINGEIRHFVFINTNSTLEKQIYTAAHELGHIWDIDKKVIAETGECDYDSETIINRFAAELLMPERHFVKLVRLKCEELGLKNGEADIYYILRIIVSMMYSFMVPYKAVIYRLLEVGFIDEKGKQVLENLEKGYPGIIEEIIQLENYQKLRQKNKEKSMGHLYEMLKSAKKQDILSDNRFKSICRQFDISYEAENIEGNEIPETEISIKTMPEVNLYDE